ncbi:hypothetical protein BO99DRAFT_398808 [Aspergillus violaceofuscus CBS 115571]|uniref:Uncharacterized protein n=1 Tax=Aspergillus violaceofuscus (strain CBS 115571) TaxID=1450538 RepID=A0A2V5HMF7_ASPV1|nr:hypothetical protein BO99DRAFT_398808 [Aspergillus violaceofuscus CBS 115571]
MARRLFGLFSFPSPSPGVAVRSLQLSSVSARPNENLRGFLWLSAFLGFFFSNPAGLIRCRTWFTPSYPSAKRRGDHSPWTGS